MEREGNKFYIRGKECEVKFIKLIGTWPGGKDYIEGQYDVTSDEEIIRLHLRLNGGSPNEELHYYENMRELSPEERKRDKDFVKNKEDQEKFFKGEGKKIVKETLMRVGGIEGIKKLGWNEIPYRYVSYSEIATIVIKGIKKRN